MDAAFSSETRGYEDVLDLFGMILLSFSFCPIVRIVFICFPRWMFCPLQSRSALLTINVVWQLNESEKLIDG